MESSFKEIYTEYKHQVYFFVKKYVKVTDDVEDIVQDIFVHIWKHSHALKNANSVQAIVFKTAKQEISNFYRRNKLSFSEMGNYSISDDDSTIELEEENQQQSNNLDELLSKIPERSKVLFLQNKLENLSYSEIAKEHNISKNAVAKHINKTLLFLKTNLNLFF